MKKNFFCSTLDASGSTTNTTHPASNPVAVWVMEELGFDKEECME